MNTKKIKEFGLTLVVLVFLIVLLAGVGFANMLLWDAAFNECVARGSSSIWCRMTEGWQIFRYLFGF